jgi:phosphoserine phosphatase
MNLPAASLRFAAAGYRWRSAHMRESPEESEARHAIVRRLVALLASRDYATLERISKGARLSASHLADAVREYGVTLLPLPPDADALVDYIQVGGATPAWSVVVPLF